MATLLGASAGPPSIVGELARTRLIAALASRWDKSVVVVEAPAGYGKSTAMAQAQRANLTSPRGIDYWISCRPEHADAAVLAEVIVAALEPDPVPLAEAVPATGELEESLRRVVRAIHGCSPLDACLILDDVQWLKAGSTGGELLAGLIRNLPSNCHLVLGGRAIPELPLARLRAADQVYVLAPDELLFNDDEVAELAGGSAHSRGTTTDYGGWPALVRLALVAPDGTPQDYLFEEVLTQLGPAERRALLALVVLDGADLEMLAELELTDGRDAETLLTRVPLLRQDEQGRVHPHRLWSEALLNLVPNEEVEQMRARGLAILERRDDVVRFGTTALEAGEIGALCRATRRLLKENLGGAAAGTLALWLEHPQINIHDEPDLLLAHGHVRFVVDGDEEAGLDEVDHALAMFIARNDTDGILLAAELITMAALARGDTGRILTIAELARDRPDLSADEFVADLLAGTDAALAELVGDYDEALTILSDRATMAPGSRSAVQRMNLLLKLGSADEAVPVADEAAANLTTPFAQGLPAYARWMAGDPSGYPTLGMTELPTAPNQRVRFESALNAVAIRASAGLTDAMQSAYREAELARPDNDSPDVETALAISRAISAIVDHDPDRARHELEAVAERQPADDPTVEARLKAHFAVPYLYLPEHRERLTAKPMGPSRQRTQAVADLVLVAREGRVRRRTALPEPDQIFTALPLPLSVELASRLVAAGIAAGRRLASYLAVRAPSTTHQELVWLAERGDETSARGATDLLAVVPPPPGGVLRIEVLGPLRLLVDGQPVDRPELARSRVRQLLVLLTIERLLSRERAVELLWGDAPNPAGPRNLRTTLTYVRRLLEPERAAGQASFHLRVDRGLIQLVDSAHLEIDLWEFEQLRSSGRLAEAAALWRGPLLTDLTDQPGLTAQVNSLRLAVVDTVLRAGELALASGDALSAVQASEHVLGAEPFSERAHRLAVAAHIHRSDAVRAEQALARVALALGELAVEPEFATVVLDRQASARFDREPTFDQLTA